MNRRRHPYQGCALPTELPQRMPYGVDSEIRTHENPGCSQAPSTARPCPRIDKLAEGTGTDPEACRLQALSRRCPSPMGLPSVFGGERRSRSPDLHGRIALEAGPDPVRFALRKMAEGGVLETRSLTRSICVQSSLGPCPIHPLQYNVAPPAGFDPAASCLTNKRSPD